MGSFERGEAGTHRRHSQRLPYVAIGYPEMAAAIGDAMNMVERANSQVGRLAEAMLDAKAGASGGPGGEDQRRRTRWMAEWLIQRLPFHGLALVDHEDGLTEVDREQRYREWLHDPIRRTVQATTPVSDDTEGAG